MTRSTSTRREILRAALGAPFAASLLEAGCAPSCVRARGVPDGELFDFGRPRGHELVRDLSASSASLASLEGWPERRASVAIIGGGVAGLSAAWRLRRAGVDDIVLLELDDTVGGTARSGRSPVTSFPWGAHYVVLPYADNPAFVALLDEMGVLEPGRVAGEPAAREEHAVREPEERHFHDGELREGLYPLHGETAEERGQRERFERELARYASLVDGSGRRAFTLPVARCSDDAEILALDRLSFAAWLDERKLTSWRLRWLCDYACRDDYGTGLADTSAWAGLFYFCSRRRNGGDDQPVLTWPEGNGRIVAHLARSLEHGPALLTGQVAVDVAPRDGAVDIATLGAAGRLKVTADDVIVAAPRFVARRIVRPLREDASASTPAWFDTSPWAVVNLHLERRPQTKGFPLAWDTVFVDSPSLGYVTATHQRGRDHGPTVLTWYRPLVEDEPKVARERLLSLDRAAWAEAALAELSLAHPDIKDVVTRVDVGRFGHAMIRPVPGLLSSGALQAAQQPIGRVSFAHTDLSGIALCEEAFFHGVRAAEEILTRRDPSTRSML